jgi:hypothetical protein
MGIFDVMVIDFDHRVIVARSAMPNTDVVHAPSVGTICLLGNRSRDCCWRQIGIYHDSFGPRDVAII